MRRTVALQEHQPDKTPGAQRAEAIAANGWSAARPGFYSSAGGREKKEPACFPPVEHNRSPEREILWIFSYPSRCDEPWYETKLLFLFPFSPQNSMMVKCVFKKELFESLMKPNTDTRTVREHGMQWSKNHLHRTITQQTSLRNTSEIGLICHPGQCFDLCCIFSHVIWM